MFSFGVGIVILLAWMYRAWEWEGELEDNGSEIITYIMELHHMEMGMGGFKTKGGEWEWESWMCSIFLEKTLLQEIILRLMMILWLNIDDDIEEKLITLPSKLSFVNKWNLVW